MAQEFPINSSTIESKINQLLPSQGGKGAGIDFSASTMVIPIVDLTETAEGSGLRQDLQRSFSFSNLTFTTIQNTLRTTIISTTGFYLIKGTMSFGTNVTPGTNFELYDGTTYKKLFEPLNWGATNVGYVSPISFEYMIQLVAGVSLVGSSSATAHVINVASRQIADISGNLVSSI